MSYHLTGYDGQTAEYATVSEALSDCRIVSVEKNPDGTFCAGEKGSEYFTLTLSRDELLAWAEELKALAG